MITEQIALVIVALFIAKRVCLSVVEMSDQVGYKRYRVGKLSERIGYLNKRIDKSSTFEFIAVEQLTSFIVFMGEVYILYVLLKALNVIG